MFIRRLDRLPRTTSALVAGGIAILICLSSSAAMAGRIRALAAGDRVTCAIGFSGTAWCWGRNNAGQLGDGTTIDQHWPKKVFGFAGAAATRDDNVCLTLLGEVACAGANNFGQIGDGTTVERHRFTGAGANIFGNTTMFPITSGNTPCAVIYDISTPYCWGWNQFGAAGDGTTIDRSLPTTLSTKLTTTLALSSSGANGRTCMVSQRAAGDPGGTLWCWGNLGPQNDTAGDVPQPDPVAVSALGPTVGQQTGAVGVGVDHTCAIKFDGTLWCWGRNDRGQLGDGTTSYRGDPVQVMVPGTGVQAVSVSPTGQFTCAIAATTSTQTATYCWGANDRGQLGNGTTSDRLAPAPVAVNAPFAEEIAAGDDHACVFQQAENFWCWGGNDNGQIGNGTTADQLLPVNITLAPQPLPSTTPVPALGSPFAALALALLVATGGFVMARARR